MPPYFSKKLDWNTVDARGADGLLQYGRVIDCAEQGLFIDFGCGTAAQHVPFGQIYRCKLEKFRERDVDDNLPVDVLWRCRPEEPPTWYPGVLLTGRFYEFDAFRKFAMVRITTPGGPSRAEIVTIDRVRQYRSPAELVPFLLEEDQFVKETVQLPSGVSGGDPSPGPYQTPPSDQRLVNCFNRKCWRQWMVATHIDGSVLHVLRITERFRRKFDRDYHSCCPKLEKETLLRMLGVKPQTQRKRPNDEQDVGTKRVATCLPSTSASTGAVVTAFGTREKSFTLLAVVPPQPDTTTSTPSLQTPSAGKCPAASMKGRFRSKSLDLSAADTMDDDSFSEALSLMQSSGINRRLPREVLAEILECFDGVPQVELRKVCALWNDILTAAPLSRMLRVREESRLCESSIIPRACLLKRWTPQTKIIIYVNPDSISDKDDTDVSDADDSDTDVRDSFADTLERYPVSLMCSGSLFRCIFQEKQLPRLDTLLLVNIAWQWQSLLQERGGDFKNFIKHILDELNSFASVCQNLVLKDVTVMLSEDNTPVVVRIIQARIAGEVSGAALWDLMDKSLPPLSPADLACWAEWMSDNSDDDFLRQLVKILKERQSDDRAAATSSVARGGLAMIWLIWIWKS